MHCPEYRPGGVQYHIFLCRLTYPSASDRFLEHIEGWGNTWMWDSLTIRGEVTWLAESIADNSLVVVTDGS